ncbi:MAG: hypothetical protein KDC00_07120 [Flavobacteriales bacterium]|nr:hypothetical protein [Flavobacteriales bacterium]
MAVSAIALQCDATIWRVRYADPTADFESIQEAINNAQYEDTIHIEPVANYTYPGADCDLKLTFIGAGFNFGESPMENPDLQAFHTTSKVDHLIFNSINANGSEVHGLHFTGQYALTIQATSEITIRGNYFDNSPVYFYGVNSYNVRIVNNYFSATFGKIESWNGGGQNTFVYLEISNNIFAGGWIDLETDDILSSAPIHHNVFTGLGNKILLGSGAIITDNVFVTQGATLSLTSSNTLENNVCADISTFTNVPPDNFDLAVSNVQGNTSGMFVNGVNSLDAMWELSNLGLAFPSYDGTQVGIFGGATPYKLSGIPPVPTIYELHMLNTAVQNQDVDVTFSTRTNGN